MIKAILFDLYGTLLYNKNRHKQIAKVVGEEKMELYDNLRRE